MNDADRRVVALAAALVPERTPALLARLATAGAADAVALGQRLARSDAARPAAGVVGGARDGPAPGRRRRGGARPPWSVRVSPGCCGPSPRGRPTARRPRRCWSGCAESGSRGDGPAGPRPVRRAAASPPPQSVGISQCSRARAAGTRRGLPDAVPLPFELPVLSRGFATLTPAARAIGARAADAAARALSALLERELAVRARAVAGRRLVRARRAPGSRSTSPRSPRPRCSRSIPRSSSAVVDVLAGGAGRRGRRDRADADRVGRPRAPRARRGRRRLHGPRGRRRACAPASLAARRSRRPRSRSSSTISSGALSGRARLLLPASAVRALRARSRTAPRSPPASRRRSDPAGRRSRPTSSRRCRRATSSCSTLRRTRRTRSSCRGGARFVGRLEGDTFHVTEMTMTNGTRSCR